jgi:hypothetical protein
MLEYMLLAALAFLLFWVLLEMFFALTFIIICELFGKNPVPATVPNKAVWG